MIKNKLKKQIKDLERILNKIESIINHNNRYILDDILLSHIINQRSKIELALETSKYALNNSNISLLESIYNTNNGLEIDILEMQLDNYINLL